MYTSSEIFHFCPKKYFDMMEFHYICYVIGAPRWLKERSLHGNPRIELNYARLVTMTKNVIKLFSLLTSRPKKGVNFISTLVNATSDLCDARQKKNTSSTNTRWDSTKTLSILYSYRSLHNKKDHNVWRNNGSRCLPSNLATKIIPKTIIVSHSYG